MSRFPEDFKAEHEAAGDIVMSRDKEGRNAEVDVKAQFTTPQSTATEVVFDLIYMKMARARSYLVAGNFSKFREELQDVSNYAIFPIVFEKAEPYVEEPVEPTKFICGHKWGEEPNAMCGVDVHWSRTNGFIVGDLNQSLTEHLPVE